MVNANARDPNSREIARVRNDLLSVENVPLSLQRLHEGLVFSAMRQSLNLAANSLQDLMIRVDPSVEMHAMFATATGGSVDVDLFENPTFSAAGGGLLVRNRNRRIADNPLSAFNNNPTITNTGTLLSSMRIPGTSTPGGSGVTGGAINQGFDEWLLTPGDTYLFRVINRQSVAADVTSMILFYEIPDPGAFPAILSHQ